jgi:hypothetical protein
MSKTKRKPPVIEPEEEPSFVPLPSSLFIPGLSDRAFRLVARIIEIVSDEEFYTHVDCISWTRRDYEDFAEAMGYSVRLMNEALREAASYGLIIVEHARGDVAVKPGPTL